MVELAVMHIDQGEEILCALVGGIIHGTGRYKLLAKKRKDKKIEWAHFVERESGIRDRVYRGELKNEKQLRKLVEIMNKNLVKTFGRKAEMKLAVAEIINMPGGLPGKPSLN